MSVVRVKGAATNRSKGSLVKVVVFESAGRWISPASGHTFYIDEEAQFPAIDFQIEDPPLRDLEWKWTIGWNACVRTRERGKRGKRLRSFHDSGHFVQSSAIWRAQLNQCVGGILNVEVRAGGAVYKRSVRIQGRNPSVQQLRTFLSHSKASTRQVEALMKIFEQESATRAFVEADGEPLVSFDGGYGLSQLTNPAPSYEQIWNWKCHVERAVAHYQTKEKEARHYLAGIVKGPTEEEIELETLSRWNGGTYFQRYAKDGKLQRNEMVCDTQTSNIGWDPGREANRGKTEQALHERDKESFSRPNEDKEWQYTGICYAEHVLR